ncbi:MAG TPA: quinohemoprotein amine dehydrogenase subunit alpha [Bryobacteraceae bacterium]|nr:quinohemoprotein amine dehydrogenase subunit alpha [Bryobacteraceae bacterium]
MFKAVWAAIALVGVPLCVQAQRGGGPAAGQQAAKPAPEEGIPVTDPLVISRCGGCHTRDAKGNMLRISWERATPEGWEEAIKRMVRLNGLTLSPQDARAIVKYLATYHGLAPEEAKPVMYFAEHRIEDETNIPDDAVRGACANCHAFARPMSWRRSADDWKLLTNFHVAFYPTAEQAFRRGLAAGGGGNAPPVPPREEGPPKLPVDDALAYLGKAAPLHTPEWAAWRARMRAPKLAGRWLVSAHIPGKGNYVGELAIEPGAAEDEFTTNVKLQSVRDGSTLVRSGQGLVYAGYSWRGRSKGSTSGTAAVDDLNKEAREVLWFSPDETQAEGRWFWGQYQEFGVDLKLRRASSDPTLIGVDRMALKAGSQANRVRLLGDNFPAQVNPSDLDFGSGVTVRRIVSRSPSEVVAEVDVAADAVSGKRDIALGRSVLSSSIAVYDRVDYIQVMPESAIARLGSDVHPKGYQQFEAIGYQRGADGKPHTADDVELGPVDVTWSVEEFYSVYGDDDKNFVGSLSPTGLFTPALDGPNPKRKFSRNNYGDVWVVATSKNDKDAFGKPLQGKSYLVVAVPMYVQFDQPEVGQ